MTEILKIDPQSPDPEIVEAAARVLRRGGLVAYPTDTVYGLASSAFVVDTLARVYDATGRPYSDPLPIHIADRRDIETLAREIPRAARPLIDAYFPGPLTLIFHRLPTVSLTLTGGRNTVAIRMPAHPVPLSIIRSFETPVVCPPASLYGRRLPVRIEEVLEDLDGNVDLALDGGELPSRIPSTVVDVTQPKARIVRPGRIPEDEIARLIALS
jgi:L-threonylcarbamoyladenylate synthase